MQFRSLVALANVGPASMTTLARRVGMQTSPGRRILESLVTAGLVVRRTGSGSHRHEVVNLCAKGHQMVSAVTARRRAAIAEIVSMMTPDHRDHLVRALTAFAEASGQLAFDVDDLL